MGLTKQGYHALVAVYLIPLLFVAFIGNTLSEGIWSDIFYYGGAFTALLLAYAVYGVFGGSKTQSAKSASNDENVVSIGDLGAIEYIYTGLLTVFAAVNWWVLHDLNKHSTGILSIVTMVWSFVSIAVAILSAIQFWRMKSGAIVEVTHKLVR